MNTVKKEFSLGIDVGTSGVKTGLLNLSNFELLAIASRAYESTSRQEPQKIWHMTVEAIKESISHLKSKSSIKAIGFSGQMHGTVLYDKNNKVIGPLINWKDDSCNKPIVQYSRKSTVEKIVELLGQDGFDDLGIDKMASGFFGATLFYIKENDISLFNKIKHAVLPADFIRGKLLGKCDYSTDQTNAFSTGLFNTRLNKWHDAFIKKLGLPKNIFPSVHYSSDIAGHISDDFADMLGIDSNIPVIYGGGDNQMSMLGSGLISPDSPVLLNIGTGAQISKITGEYKKISGIDTRSFLDGNFTLVGASLGGGTSYKWLQDEIKKIDGFDVSFSEMDQLASKVAPGADGLRFCTGPSRRKPDRKTSFAGNLTNLKSIGHKARAVMEGVVLELYEFYRLFGQDNCDYIMAAGNALQKSKVWAQISADIFRKPLRITNFENAVFGAGLMAAKGIGKVDSFYKIIRRIKYIEVIPDSRNMKEYQTQLKLN